MQYSCDEEVELEHESVLAIADDIPLQVVARSERVRVARVSKDEYLWLMNDSVDDPMDEQFSPLAVEDAVAAVDAVD